MAKVFTSALSLRSKSARAGPYLNVIYLEFKRFRASRAFQVKSAPVIELLKMQNSFKEGVSSGICMRNLRQRP